MLGAVLFDLDGTLVNSERQCAESVARVLLRLGRVMTDAERDFVVGHGWNEIYAELVSHGGVEVPLPELQRLAAVEREQLVEAEGLHVLPGAVELVRRLAARYPATIVSGSSRAEIAMSVAALDLGTVISWFVGSEDVTHGKPAPEGYLLAARHLGVEPRRCLVIEDSQAGIRAGLDAGMRVVGVRAGNFAGQRQDDAHLVVDTLLQLDDHAISTLFSDGGS